MKPSWNARWPDWHYHWHTLRWQIDRNSLENLFGSSLSFPKIVQVYDDQPTLNELWNTQVDEVLEQCLRAIIDISWYFGWLISSPVAMLKNGWLVIASPDTGCAKTSSSASTWRVEVTLVIFSWGKLWLASRKQKSMGFPWELSRSMVDFPYPLLRPSWHTDVHPQSPGKMLKFKSSKPNMQSG